MRINNFFKTYKKRMFTTVLLLIATMGWMFTGAIYLEPIFGNKPPWAAYTFMIINSIIFVGCLWEIINLKKTLKWSLFFKIFIIITGLVVLWFPLGKEQFGPYLYNDKWFEAWMTLLLLIAVVISLLLISWKSKNLQIIDIIFIMMWILYLTFTFKAINFLMLSTVNYDNNELGWPTLLLLLVIVIANDIGAFIGGVLYGHTKLAPHISPAKTWEGAISGLITAMVLTMVLVTILLQTTNYYPLPFYEGKYGKAPIFLAYCAISFIFSIISQMGDLLFSLCKRKHNVKDFSHIFPGHGGFLDRLDSLSAVVIAGWLLILLITTH